MEKNGEYVGIVEGLGTNGEGVIKLDNFTAFVPFCLVGERVKFKALKVKGNIVYGKLSEVIKPSADRVTPACPVYAKCGGCDLQHISYARQLEIKRNTVQTALQKIGGIVNDVSPTVPCEKIYGYRNKLVLPVGEDKPGTVCGFYAPHSHRIVPIDACAIQADWVGDVISAIKQFAKKTGLKGYDDLTHTGDLRHIVVREIKGRFVFALVVSHRLDAAALAEILKESFGQFTLLLNINPKPTNVIFGDSWVTVYGDGFFEAEECGIKYSAGANTFLQVNDDVRAKLYNAVLGSAEEGATALDLYSGGGMLTAMLAKKCGSAYGIEIVPEASRCAEELKERNALGGKMFNICGAVEDKIDEVFARTAGRRIIVCDPPRKGMERSVVKKIAASDADKIILVSCNPATLARDLGILTGTLIEQNGELVKCASPATGYAIDSITPFDMFPQTKHVETLVILSRK